ncbi:tRNA pseudouridine32 synthase/23S rRNA pseudouridine746 synthase [Trueperella bonasi]|uniref:RNA pseudouridylate synthase n=1 Tax=Trueperella bonasi TaxID=312286 RepID=A0ABT9NFK5_9ACTO|nr:pseudouridine synthase [Trueperella bonasi]MDP9805828.1 tRNA pseudouridine32 synthase/23S rRNA pseudouridine746 synthase [Trueperella bonasi]
MSRRRPRSQRRSERQRELRPAFRAGVNASPVMLPDADFACLGEWARERFGESGRKLFERGDIFFDFSAPARADDPYRAGERVWIFRPVPDEPDEPIVLEVVHRAERFVVVDKPHGIATIPRGMYVAKTVTVAARRQFHNDDVVAAHRLDAETAGLVLLTGEPAWRGPYQDLFARREVHKVYFAVAPAVDMRTVAAGRARVACDEYGDGWATVDLRIEREAGAIAVDVVDGEPNSRTHIRMVRELGDGLALYELHPISGRLHQLRATMNHLGAPIVGDPLYPDVLSLEATAARDLPTQLLAAQLAFRDPVDGTDVVVKTRRTLALAPELVV